MTMAQEKRKLQRPDTTAEQIVAGLSSVLISIYRTLRNLFRGKPLYQPLAQGHLRLLTILSVSDQSARCRLTAYPYESAPEYDAVSYCWGDDQTPASITCNGQKLHIRKNLLVALKHLADRPDNLRPLWVDALCLNQKDDIEKGTHVPLMHQVYRNASRTIVWLGEPDGNTDTALNFMAEVVSHLENERDPKVIDKSERPQDWAAVRDYLQRPWFYRMWTFQESILSQNLEILCHTKKWPVLTWRSLIDFRNTIDKHRLRLNLLEGSSGITIVANLVSMETARETLRAETLREETFTQDILRREIGQHLGILTIDSQYRRCHEPVDRVWALLGLLRPSLVTRITEANIVDYSDSGRRDYWKSYVAVMKILHVYNVNDFHYIISSNIGRTTSSHLPSWCPDFNSPRVYWPFSNFTAGFANAEDHSTMVSTLDADLDTLSVTTGFCVDEVRSTTSIAPCGDEQLKIASAVHPILSDTLKDHEEVGYFNALLAWLQECTNLAQETLGVTEDAMEAFYQTLISADHQKESKYSGVWIHAYRALVNQLEDPIRYEIKEKLHVDYDSDLRFKCNNRVFFTTVHGRIGLGPPGLRAGDKICVFTGTELLFALRKAPYKTQESSEGHRDAQGGQSAPAQEAFTLIGDAYLHGMMYGEAFTAKGRGPEQALVLV